MTRLAIIGTSWWVDAMYLPALTTLDGVLVAALAGRNEQRARSRADAWSVDGAYTDWRTMIDKEQPTGLVVAASNPVHYPATKFALERGIHVLCEKPVAENYARAAELADLADRHDLVTMVPFTYAFMPGFRFLHHLVDDGYVGRLHHLSFHYHAGYALGGEYDWKLDARANPSGALGDIGSHFLHLALLLGGTVRSVTANLSAAGRRTAVDPRGEPYPVASDTATVILEFDSGATGHVHASSVAHEGTSMDQRHLIELHGSDGTLRYECDWDHLQEVRGARVGTGPPRPMPIPDEIWGPVRRESVHDTYRDVFRTTDVMAREWAASLEGGHAVRPDLRDGAQVQLLLDRCLESSLSGARLSVEDG